jgi:hypothetical protein
MKGDRAVTRPTAKLSRLAAEEVWRKARGLKGGKGGPPRGYRDGIVVAERIRLPDAPAACRVLGLEPTSVYGSLRRGFVLVKVPIRWEDDAKANELADRLMTAAEGKA